MDKMKIKALKKTLQQEKKTLRDLVAALAKPGADVITLAHQISMGANNLWVAQTNLNSATPRVDERVLLEKVAKRSKKKETDGIRKENS